MKRFFRGADELGPGDRDTDVAIPGARGARRGAGALARPGTNLRFWVTLRLALLPVAALALYLSRRERTTDGPR
jgi:hypothetical protein